MANFFTNFLNSLHLSDNDDENDDEEYDEYVEETSSREQKRLDRKAERESRRLYAESAEEESAFQETPRSNTSSFNDARKERTERRAERSATKVVPFRSGAGSVMGIKVMKPTSFEDSQDICDVLLAGKATIINLEGFNVDLAQRVMDFISGAVYAVNGKLHQISNYIFIISPDNVDISGDYLDMIKQNGFDVPTINKEY